MSAGIDYGMGKSNIDVKTGIRYGCISQNSILQAWADDAEPYYIGRSVQDLDDVEYEDLEPTSYVLDDGEYLAESCLNHDVILIKSPYFTYCKFCSPCVPGAGNLDSPSNFTEDGTTDGVATYCFGHDWFDSGVAPYRVYSLTTGKVVGP